MNLIKLKKIINASIFSGCIGVVCIIVFSGCSETWDECDRPEDCGNGMTCHLGRCIPISDTDSGEFDSISDEESVSYDFTEEFFDVPDVPYETENTTQCGDVTFELTETQETLIIPNNVKYMHVKAWGAGGNEEHSPGTCPNIYDDAGLGGFTEAVFEIVPGTNLIVIVGKLGRAGDPPPDRVRFGFGNWGGGGLSGIFMGPDPITESSQDKAILIAGGGGGSGGDCAYPGGTGNSDDSGGQSTMQGSDGADGVNGGGGGYHGGTGGARGKGGKGGSGFVVSNGVFPEIRVLDSRIMHSEPGVGHPPKTDDPDYDGEAGGIEKNGRVVIHFTCEPPQLI